MKKIDFSGWKDIYSFSFLQTMKSKSFISSLIILCLIAFAAPPVLAFISNDDSKKTVVEINEENNEENNEESIDKEENSNIGDIETVYFCFDEGNEYLSKKYDEWARDFDCNVELCDKDTYETLRKSINEEDSSYCIFDITKENGIYSLSLITKWDVMDSMDEYEEISEKIANELNEIQIAEITGVNNVTQNEVYVSGRVGNSDEKYSDGMNMLGYGISIGFITIFVFILSFSGESIASSVVTEKSGKMVEFLMITVRPMAILAGKILAVLTTVLIQLLLMMLCGGISAVLTSVIANISITEKVAIMIENVNNKGMEFNISFPTILFIISFVIGGLLFYALLASIAGAAVSKIEELSEGIVIYTFTLVAGAYFSIAMSLSRVMGSGMSTSLGTGDILCCLMPISSAFYVPQNLLNGYVGYGFAAVSLVILYAFVVFLVVFASKVYEYMLFYNGATLKIKDIIHIALHGKVKEAK